MTYYEKTKEITFEMVCKYYNLSKDELRDMCSENSDLLYDLKSKMVKGVC